MVFSVLRPIAGIACRTGKAHPARIIRLAEKLRQRMGSISFLIAQHAYQQGYYCIDALFRAIVLKIKVEPVNYMPIELLTKENVAFYRRMQL